MGGTPSLPGVRFCVTGRGLWLVPLLGKISGYTDRSQCSLSVRHLPLHTSFFLTGSCPDLTARCNPVSCLSCVRFPRGCHASDYHIRIIGSWGQRRVFTRGHNTGRGYWLLVYRQQADLHRVDRCNLQLPGLVIWYYEIEYLYWVENIPKFLQYPWQHSPYPSPEDNIGTKFSKV